MDRTILLAYILLIICHPPTICRATDDDIEYWTDYAIHPRRCVNYNGMDQIMYAMYEKSSNHCQDSPLGTFVTPVPTFVDAYLEQTADNYADAGQEYEYPYAVNYLECSEKLVDGESYYLQLGCSDDDSSSLAVNIYSDAQCTEPSEMNGYDDANVEVDMDVGYKCTPCVIWSDKNDDEIDDQYYENKQTNAPLCSTMWEYRQECSGKCLVLAKEASEREGWNQADRILLTILSLFGLGMLLSIVKKRQTMSNKDALLEQAAITAAGLSQSHVLGIFALLVLIITMFALLGLKKITWALLLLINVVLFAYLMKLTVDSSVKETIIGPDGKIVERDDSDDEDDDDEPISPTSAAGSSGAGDYSNPKLPQIS